MAAQLVGRFLEMVIHSVEGMRDRLRAPATQRRRVLSDDQRMYELAFDDLAYFDGPDA